jgi:hypothetical protein
MEIYLKNTERGLIPMYESDSSEKKKLKIGEVYKVKITRSRNYEFHKKYFALIRLAHQNYPNEMPESTFRKWLQMKAGFVDSYQTEKGVFFDTPSIMFDKMNEDEFKEVYNAVLNQVVKLLQTESEIIENELINFM